MEGLLENQWVDKDDVFADKALQEFKTLNPASKVHIRRLHIPEDHIPTSSVKYMSSPTPSTIANVVIPSGDPQDYLISCIFGQLIEPEHGRVSPDFLEYQDTGSINARGNQEGESVEAHGGGVEAGTNCQSLPQSSSLVSVTTISDISNLLCATTVPQNTVTTTNITQSLSLLWRASTLSATSSSTYKRPKREVLDLSSGTPSTMMTATKRTTRMPQKYRPNLRGKGWVRVEDTEEDAEEVDEVWEMQKRALLDSTTLGKRTQSEYRWAAVRLPSPASSSSIKALRTSLSPSPMTRDGKSPPNISRST